MFRGAYERSLLLNAREEFEHICRAIEGDETSVTWTSRFPVFPTIYNPMLEEHPLPLPTQERLKHVSSITTQKTTELAAASTLMGVQSAIPVVSTNSQAQYDVPLASAIAAMKLNSTSLPQSATGSQSMNNTSLWDDEANPNFSQDFNLIFSEDDRHLNESLPNDVSELRRLRNQTAMELLWVDEAIASRQQYVTLRTKLESE